jgi:hypothetical protein
VSCGDDNTGAWRPTARRDQCTGVAQPGMIDGVTDRPGRADEGVERTEDGRYIVVAGRRWRASDPSIPENLRAELVRALMHGRRQVRSHGDAARVMVHDAKVALGERGEPWWESSEQGTRKRLAATIRTLLRSRGQGSICPSDAARAVGGEQWRELMGVARSVAFELREEGIVAVTQRGARVSGTSVTGPIRIVADAGLEFMPNDD